MTTSASTSVWSLYLKTTNQLLYTCSRLVKVTKTWINYNIFRSHMLNAILFFTQKEHSQCFHDNTARG